MPGTAMRLPWSHGQLRDIPARGSVNQVESGRILTASADAFSLVAESQSYENGPAEFGT